MIHKKTAISNTLHIPDRATLHREYAGEIRISDFCTEHPRPRRIYPFTAAERKRKPQSSDEGR